MEDDNMSNTDNGEENCDNGRSSESDLYSECDESDSDK